MTFLETARDTDGELLQMEYVAPTLQGTKHVHPRQEERYAVVSGVLGLRAWGSNAAP
jgi:mannose-6-phosphate isomerase-like protein (cupin superfamily)